MAFDAHKNLAISAVATAPTPATSGTSLVVTAGHGARFPAPPFNVTIWPATAPPDPLTAEVARVTARATDTLTLQRAQEGSTARLIGVGDLIAQTITAKTLTDLETQAALLAAANVFTAAPQTIQHAGLPAQLLVDTTQPANARGWKTLNNSQALSFQPADDAGAGLSTALGLARVGDAYIGRHLYERGRLTPLGHAQTWNTVATTNEGAALGGTVASAFTLIGQTVCYQLTVTSMSIPTATAGLRFTIPPGYVPLGSVSAATLARLYVPGAAWQWGWIDVGAQYLTATYPAGNWPAGAAHVFAQGFYFTAS